MNTRSTQRLSELLDRFGPSSWFTWRKRRPLTVAVMGAGNGGLAMAADLAVAGHQVRLFNRSPERLAAVLERGGIELTKDGPSGAPGEPALVKLSTVTTDPAAAIEGAELIMVVIPAIGHRRMAELCAPHLADGQVVVLNPGRTGGALEFRASLEASGCQADVVIAEASTFLFAARAIAPAGARIYGTKRRVTFAALPASRNPEVAALLTRAYPGRFMPASSVLETSLENIGAVFHPAITLLNAGRIEDDSASFEFYRQGASPSVARIIEAVDAERCRVARALGVPHVTALEWMRRSYGVNTPDLYTALRTNPGYAGIPAPGQLRHRYLTEDIPTSLVPLASFGHLLGVPTPAIRSLIDLASAMHGLDYFTVGRTVERLGLSGSSVADILARVLEGSAVA
ncbi:MAG: NAD/NADP octopine/nopaline dehydrogenase family protein [Bacillota bacterium]